MSFASAPVYGSASRWMESVVGSGNTQYGNTFNIGQDNNKDWGNNILPKDFNGHTFGGRSRRRGGMKSYGMKRGGMKRGGMKRGGSLMGAIGTAIPPFALLATQYNYKKNRNIYSKRSRRFKR